MRMNNYVLLFFLLGFNVKISAESIFSLGEDSALLSCVTNVDESAERSYLVEKISTNSKTELSNSILIQHYQKAFHENKRITAALLTFSLGMLGVHRLYLGTKPWIPAAYLFTFGGGFFILPLIDCVAILCCKDLTQFLNNDHFIMWIQPDK